MRSQAAPTSIANDTKVCFPPVDLGSGPLRRLVGIELPVLHKLGSKPRDLPRLSLHGVSVGGGNHTI
jgi:hypothetical protein